MRLVLLYEWNLSANSTVCVYTCEVVTPQSSEFKVYFTLGESARLDTSRSVIQTPTLRE